MFSLFSSVKENTEQNERAATNGQKRKKCAIEEKKRKVGQRAR
jgi:hypothetical protein